MAQYRKYITQTLPEFDVFWPSSYDQAFRILRPVAFAGYTHDVCVNFCVVFWADKEELSTCPVCQEERFKSGSKTARKTVHYISFREYIQRLLDIPEYAAACQTNNVLRHLEKKEIADVLQGKLFKEKVATLIGADYIFPFIEYDDGVQGIVDICIMNKE
jgi:hypothetical protein